MTSALQEDFLAHSRAAASKLLAVLDNGEYILALELLAADQTHDFLSTPAAPRVAGKDALYSLERTKVAHYDDDRSLGRDMGADPRHGLSSSHGDSRLIRLGYFEDPSYEPLPERANATGAPSKRGSGRKS